MSLLDGKMNQAGARPESNYERRTRLFGETYARNNESFGEHMSDGVSAVAPAAARTSKAIMKFKAEAAMDRRNKLYGNESEYVTYLSNVQLGNTDDWSGNNDEAQFYIYIAQYCDMETAVLERNQYFGNTNPEVDQLLAAFPYDSRNVRSLIAYCNKIANICNGEVSKAKLKVGMDKAGKFMKGVMNKFKGQDK